MTTKKKMSIDGGWAWVILFVGVFGNALIGGACYSTGVLNVLFLDAFNDSRGKTAWIGAINVCLLSSGGPLSSMLVNVIGFRWTIIVGGLLSMAGCVLSVFCTEVNHLILTYGLVTGTGLGLAYTPVVTCVGYYFDKYRIMAASVSSIGAGLGTFIFAPIVQALADLYDWRGTLLLIGGIQLHLCICGALVRPIEKACVDNTEKIQTREKSDDVCDNEKRQRLCCDIPLFKNGKFVLTASSILFTTLGQFIVYIHLSAYALENGSSHDEAALLMAVVGVTNVLGRFICASSATDNKVGSLLMYTGSLGVNGMLLFLTPLLMPYYWGQLLVASLFGFYGNAWVPLLTPLTVEYVGLPLLTTAYGCEMFMSGIGCMLGPPVAGWIYDGTGSYEYGFYLAGFLVLMSSVLMMMIPMVQRENTENDDDTKEKHDEPAAEIIVV